MTVQKTSVTIFVLLGFISISLKSLFSYPVDYVAQWPEFRDRIESELHKAGFSTVPMYDGGVVVGSNDSCTVYFYPSRPEGGDEPLRRKQLQQAGDLMFWYSGELYFSRPVAIPILMRNVYRVFNAVGAEKKYFPVFGVVYSGECNLRTLKMMSLERPEAGET